MDDIDRKLLAYLVRQIPLDSKPFEVIGKKVGIDGAEVLFRIQRLIDGSIIKGIYPFFDGSRLGVSYEMTAMKLAHEKLEKASVLIQAYPGIFQSFLCEHEYNIWFVVSGWTKDLIKNSLNLLKELLEPEKFLHFAWVHRSGASLPKNDIEKLTPEEKKVIDVLQKGFSLCDEPYRKMARICAMEEQKFVECVKKIVSRGYLKKIAASMFEKGRQQKPKKMLLWEVPEEKSSVFLRALEAIPDVLSCMKRQATVDLPYSVIAKVREDSIESLEKTMQDQKLCCWPLSEIRILEEWKNENPKFFFETQFLTKNLIAVS